MKSAAAALIVALVVALPVHPATVIVNARIVDGTGAPARLGSVRIAAGRIEAVGGAVAAEGDEIVDAAGLVLAPGFIDTHSHHDYGLFEEPEAVAATSQGITTIVAGQDGSMSLPVAELFARLEQSPAAVNVASYVGHNDIRRGAMGDDFRRAATPDEIERMRARVEEAMQAGALGLSTGLEYEPGLHSTTGELVVLAREAARHGGRYISHIRSEDRDLWQALDEIVQIGREAKLPVQVSHMKLGMVDWWGQAARYLEVLDRARQVGIEVAGDIYPYEYWQSTLTVLFPDRDFGNRETASMILQRIAPPEGLRISKYSPEPALEGMTVAEIAARQGRDPADTLIDLVARSQAPGAQESVIGTSMHPDDVAALLAWPHANICTDGSLKGRHPRSTGAFTRVLRLYVREKGLLTLEEAVRKMTSAAASHVGIANRGVISPGARADLVLFDPETVADTSTTAQPASRSAGISRVWVNGVVVLVDGAPTGARPGQVVRRR